MQHSLTVNLAEVNQALERERWGLAIQLLEGLGQTHPKYQAAVSNLLHSLYISRNRFDRLSGLCPRFRLENSKDCLAALLLFRNEQVGYKTTARPPFKIEDLEKAIEAHNQNGLYDITNLHLSICFLSKLNRPACLKPLFASYVAVGGGIDNALVETILACLIQTRRLDDAQRFIWGLTVNDIAFERFQYLIRRAAGANPALPEGQDKVLNFLRLRSGVSSANPS